MPPLTARQSVELFQLAFLRALTARSEDKALFALKGGCNLRFFHGSIRYSQDIDFDVTIVARDTLRKNVDKLLASPLVTSLLRTREIAIVDVSAPKQTETTQRWKLGLQAKGLAEIQRTKIEFSRREAIDGGAYEKPLGEVLRAYALTPFLASHYVAARAVSQKIRALAGRTEPQTRDVFDLSHLFAQIGASTLDPSDRSRVPAAIEAARAMSYDEYRSQVVAYLDPEQAAPYESPEAWNAMQGSVVETLESLR